MVPLAWQHRLGLAATSRPQTPAVNTILGWHHHPCSCLTDCTGANRMHITWRRRRRPTLTNAAATIVGLPPDTPMCTAVPLAWWHTSCPPKSQRHLNGLAVQRCSPLSCSRLQQSPSIGSARTATCAKTLCLSARAPTATRHVPTLDPAARSPRSSPVSAHTNATFQPCCVAAGARAKQAAARGWQGAPKLGTKGCLLGGLPPARPPGALQPAAITTVTALRLGLASPFASSCAAH